MTTQNSSQIGDTSMTEKTISSPMNKCDATIVTKTKPSQNHHKRLIVIILASSMTLHDNIPTSGTVEMFFCFDSFSSLIITVIPKTYIFCILIHITYITHIFVPREVADEFLIKDDSWRWVNKIYICWM
jgi:hypothetical protein